MELTNHELIEAQLALKKLVAERMPIKLGLTLVKLCHTLEGPAHAALTIRDALLKQYQIELVQENGGVTINSKIKGNVQKFTTKFDELLTLTTELDVAKVKLPSTISVEPSVLLALEKFVEF